MNICKTGGTTQTDTMTIEENNIYQNDSTKENGDENPVMESMTGFLSLFSFVL